MAAMARAINVIEDSDRRSGLGDARQMCPRSARLGGSMELEITFVPDGRRMTFDQPLGHGKVG